jgi:two-component system sensor histidine kinase PhoQ
MNSGRVPDPSDNPASGHAARRPFSLRLRLILLATAFLIVALGLVGMALNTANYRSTVSSLQARMESYVYLILAAAEVDEKGRLIMQQDLGDPRLSQPGSGIYAHVHGAEDHWNSPSALGLDLPELATVQTGQTHFSEPLVDVDFFTLQYGFGFQAEQGQLLPFTVTLLVEQSEIGQQTSAFRLGLWRALGTAGLILVAAQLLMLVLAFRPLRRVARDVASIETGQTSRLEGLYPSELEPLARNVNRLLETEQSNQKRIRNALDSLAHSLKTPLAVIQSGLEVQPHNNQDSSREPMQSAVDQMSHLISTRLERAGASTRRALSEPVALAPQLERVLDSLQKIYSHKMIETRVTISDELDFYGEKRDLLELMGNLLDNAFKYGKSTIGISAGALGADKTRPGLWLRVEDDGPGIEVSERQRLLQRGVRGDERVEGHGLGLAIVTELVTAYGGQVAIADSQLGGNSISVEIPAS